MKVTLGTLREYLDASYENLLCEGRLEDAREKYPDMSDEDFEYLVANQPAGSNNKYLMWACKQVDEGYANEVTIQAIRLFDGNKQRLQKKDLYQYKEPGEVEDAIDKLGGPSKNQQAQQARADTDVIYNDDQFMVVRPHTTEASCKYGAGTRWCIAATASRNYFHQYSVSNNKFYFIIDKQAAAGSPNAKLAVVINDAVTDENTPRIQVFNTPDHQVGLKTAINHCGAKWPAIWAKIKEHVAANSITREVEEARKATGEHVKSLLKGEKVGKEGLLKIARDADLTPKVVDALIKTMKAYTGPKDHTDPRSDIIGALSERAAQLPPAGALELLKYVPSLRPEGDRYWSGNYHIERFVKNSPLTPEAFRDLIANTTDDNMIRMIIENPNCPDDIIKTLGDKVTEIRNTELQRQVYRSLIKKGIITADQMRTAMTVNTGYYGIAYDILHNPELSSKLSPDLLRLVPVKNGDELKKFLALPNVPPDLAAELVTKYWSQLKKYDLYELLKNIKLPTEMIERIWADKDQHIRVALLQNPSIGPENLTKFAQSRNSAYRFAVAHNPATDAAALQALAGDESASTRAAVAANEKTPAETLRVLAGDEATQVRASVASNNKAPVQILNYLRRDTDNFVRKAAAKTLKSVAPAEAVVSPMLGMQSLILEELADDDAEDVMNPSWRDIPTDGVEIAEFIAIYLLQNNGSATREELESAYQDWQGRAGAKKLWQTNRYSDEIIRGTTAGGRGWYWAPPGINKGALFRLTPAGASAAMALLKRNQGRGASPQRSVTSSSAIAGKTYYLPQLTSASEITDYANAELGVEEIAVDRNGAIVRQNGQPVRLSPNRSKRDQRRQSAAKALEITRGGNTTYVLMTALPKVNLAGNSAVQFVKTFHGFAGRSNGYYGYNNGADHNQAMVRQGERFFLVPFPLWTQEHGELPATREPNVAPPVKKSPPHRDLNPRDRPTAAAPAAGAASAAAPAAAAGPRGPKTTYKIYGRFKGHPVATRLKGQAYVGAAGTQFSAGEQAEITPTADGKLTVKKPGGDHTQTWEPVDG